MLRILKNSKSVASFDEMSWAGGVVDALARIYLYIPDGKSRKSRKSEFAVRSSPEVCGMLLNIVGGKMHSVRVGNTWYHEWYIPGAEQREVLERIMPFMRVQYGAAMSMYQDALVRKSRQRIKEEPRLKEFRVKLAQKVREHRVNGSDSRCDNGEAKRVAANSRPGANGASSESTGVIRSERRGCPSRDCDCGSEWCGENAVDSTIAAVSAGTW